MFLSGPCGRPADIPNATFVGRNFGYKDKIKYSCEKGFKLSGPKKRTCRGNGKWSRPPTCSRKDSLNNMIILIRLLFIFADQVFIDPTFSGIFVCGPLQSFVVNLMFVL